MHHSSTLSSEPLTAERVAREIRRFIVTNFLFGEDDPELTDESSLVDLGIVDSTGVLELVEHVEATFGIEIRDEEMTPRNLDSLRSLSRFVLDKQS